MTPPFRSHPLPGRAVPFPVDARLARVQAAVVAKGGRPVVVGGAVRDHLLGIAAKDLDVEIYGLSLETVEQVLAPLGSVHAVGRSFGVLKLSLDGDLPGDEPFDIALPRSESKVGRGHRGFVVESDPHLPFATAAARRDFTINAIGWDLASHTLVDPHHGADDLAAGVLRHVSPAFDEDPLRVLRACQFAARFDLDIAEETLARTWTLESELPSLAAERVWEEFKKLLLKAEFPSVGLWALKHTRALSLFPEIAALDGCAQERAWHPEGDVFVHTLLVTDAAAALTRAQGLDAEERLVVILGALCHDFGKPSTTAFEDGRIRSKGHESAGEAPTRAFLERMGVSSSIVDAVVPLVGDHLKPFQLYSVRETLKDGAIRRLALRSRLDRLALVARADCFGRTTADALARHDPASAWLLDKARELQVEAQKPRPILLGRHLLALGFSAGPGMGRALERAFEAQLDGAFDDEDGACRWAETERSQLESAFKEHARTSS